MSEHTTTNVLAIISLVCGLLSLPAVMCCYGLPFNLIGLITGAIAIVQINADPEHLKGKGLAIGGILASLASFAVLIFAMIFFAGVIGTGMLQSM